MHKQGIVHRDLKPENVLLKEVANPQSNSQTGTQYQVKICDLGAAKVLDASKSKLNTPYVVSRYYRAPELILGSNHYDTSIDIWAAGCMLFELLTSIPLFPGENEGMQVLEHALIIGMPND